MEESSVCGIRMARYFGWTVPQSVNDEVQDKETAASSKETQPNSIYVAPFTNNNNCCAKETHALWGCRAIALGCAADLVQLKECFQQHDNQDQLLQVSQMACEPIQSKQPKVPCMELQQALGACVTKSAAELEA